MSKIETTKSYHEITTQDAAWAQTLACLEQHREGLRNFFSQNDGDLVFVASGSSYWMSLSAHITARMQTGRNAYAVKAGDVLLCAEEYERVYHNPTFICPSRSGKTTEVLRAIDILQKAYPGSRIVSIVVYENAELASRSDYSLSIPWANEASVCQTRSFSCLYLASILMAACAADDNRCFDECHRFVAAAPTLFAKTNEAVQSLVRDHAIQGLVCLGAGRQYGVCIEGAYIVIEMAQFNTNYYNLLEYRHGPIVTAKQGTLVFLLSNACHHAYEASIADEIRRTGATVIAVGGRPLDYADLTLVMEGDFSRELTALGYLYGLQLLACALAVKRGVDPDNPGNLVPYIQF